MNLSYSYNGVPRSSFGTPSYPSPLDRIRSNDRRQSLGLCSSQFTSCRHASYEGNQSFPKVSLRNIHSHEENSNKSLKDFTGELIQLYIYFKSGENVTEDILLRYIRYIIEIYYQDILNIFWLKTCYTM